ncbi:MAG: hypothetical protein ABF718_03510 [Leuconostoc pseudomesenteroides]|uniref:hypothetical protein n=1 Tax=Leuconostoc pseudomesenteroides TaxID=33968 RepID=UPI0039E8D8F4
MKTQIVFEYKRILRSKIIWLVLCGLVILTTIPYFSLPSSDKGQLLSDYRMNQMSAQQGYDSLKNITKARKTMMTMAKINQNAEDVVSALENNQSYEKKALKYWESVQSATNSGQLQGDQPITIQMKIDRLSWSINHKERATIPTKNIPVVSYIVYVLWENVTTIIWLVTFILIIINLYIPENGDFGRRFINRIPLAKWKKILSKSIVAITSYFAIAITSFIPISIFLMFKNGFGNLNQQLVSTADGENIIHQSSFTYIERTIILTTLLMIIILFFQLIIVNFVKQSLPQLGIMIGLLIASQNTSIFSKGLASKYLPMNYLDLNRIVIGKSDISTLFINNGNVTTNELTIVLLSWSLALIFIAMALSYKRKTL